MKNILFFVGTAFVLSNVPAFAEDAVPLTNEEKAVLETAFQEGEKEALQEEAEEEAAAAAAEEAAAAV